MFWRKRDSGLKVDFLVFGLGNPGIDYVRTRHNVGWWALDELARRHGVERSGHKHRGQFELVTIAGVRCALIKPTTFMNRSGGCVAAWRGEFPDTPLIVVFDDISMETGKVRLRDSGSSGGHKGAGDIIRALRSEDFDRIKIGVGAPPPHEDAADYVLDVPQPGEEELLATAIGRAADALGLLVRGERAAAINALVRAG